MTKSGELCHLHRIPHNINVNGASDKSGDAINAIDVDNDEGVRLDNRADQNTFMQA